MEEEKKEKQKYQVGDVVIVNDKKCTLIYGPYNIALNYYFEVEDENGEIYPINTKTIKAQNLTVIKNKKKSKGVKVNEV